MKYKDRTFRPGRVIKGATEQVKSAVTGKVSEEAQARRAKCDLPCKFKKDDRCTVCGCITNLKSQSPLDYCPKNFWEDIKVVEELGLAVKNLSPDKVVLKYFGGNVVRAEFLQEVNHQEPVTLNFEVVNDRSTFFDKGHAVTGIQITTSCHCTSVGKNVPPSLGDGKSFQFTVTYDAERLGTFEKKAQIKSDNLDTLLVVIKGRVIKTKTNE